MDLTPWGCDVALPSCACALRAGAGGDRQNTGVTSFLPPGADISVRALSAALHLSRGGWTQRHVGIASFLSGPSGRSWTLSCRSELEWLEVDGIAATEVIPLWLAL